MTLSYTACSTYPVPPAGRGAIALRTVLVRGTFANFRGRP